MKKSLHYETKKKPDTLHYKQLLPVPKLLIGPWLGRYANNLMWKNLVGFHCCAASHRIRDQAYDSMLHQRSLKFLRPDRKSIDNC
uniref:Uncharacterized protein n=1 Tax=Romanomermis culicivorax TaxID=13658 RepID=A0A915JRA5_ROMCU